MKRSERLRPILLSLSLFGCSGEGSSTASTAGSGGDPNGNGGSAGGGGSPLGKMDAEAPFDCPAPGHGAARDELPFSSLSAVVVDLQGQPIEGVHAQACGLDLCLRGDTEADGSVVIQNDAEMQAAAFKYGLGQKYAKFAYPLPARAEHALGEQTTARLPDDGQALVAGATVSSGGVTLELPEEMNPLEIDPFDFDTDALRSFRAVEIPIAQSPDAVDPNVGLERLFGVGPVGVELCPLPQLSIENTADWSPGEAVEVWLHGVEIAEDHAPYGGWAKVADARVSDDGSRIVTEPRQGLPILGVFGLRRAL